VLYRLQSVLSDTRSVHGSDNLLQMHADHGAHFWGDDTNLLESSNTTYDVTRGESLWVFSLFDAETCAYWCPGPIV